MKLMVGIICLFIFGLFFIPMAFGLGGCGPTRTQEIVVQRLYVDNSGETSHYMVGTDCGVFEVDNGLFLGMWNADEVYSKLKEQKRYRVVTKGNKVVGMFLQSYPYIVQVTEIKEDMATDVEKAR
jgi:hypothetical protein